MALSDCFVSGFIACMFVLWPFAGKHAGTSGAWLAAIVMLTTGVVVAMIAAARGELTTTPSLRAVGILLVAGVLNGLGCYLYGVWASTPRIPTATFVVCVTIAMCVVAPLLEAVLLKRLPTLHHLAGFSCAALAVYLLR